jgi:hypothetical protein
MALHISKADVVEDPDSITAAYINADGMLEIQPLHGPAPTWDLCVSGGGGAVYMRTFDTSVPSMLHIQVPDSMVPSMVELVRWRGAAAAIQALDDLQGSEVLAPKCQLVVGRA